MDFTAELHKEHSKRQSLNIASYINEDTEKFAEFLKVFLNGDFRTTQRASQILNYCVSKSPYLIQPYIGQLLENLTTPVHDAVTRNTLRVLQFVDIPEEHMGQACEISFDILTGKRPVAIKVFAMTVLYHISLKFPEIGSELKYIIEEQLPYSSAAFKARGSKIIKNIERKNKIKGLK